jgi:hypothetical protein
MDGKSARRREINFYNSRKFLLHSLAIDQIRDTLQLDSRHSSTMSNCYNLQDHTTKPQDVAHDGPCIANIPALDNWPRHFTYLHNRFFGFIIRRACISRTHAFKFFALIFLSLFTWLPVLTNVARCVMDCFHISVI